jgi:hypothetical protein
MIIRVKNFLSTLKFELSYMLTKQNYGPKVFCIGYNKTGTTTVGKALEQLGFRNSSFNKKVWRDYYKKGKIEKVIEYTSKFDSVDDLPWLLEDMIPILDQKFPGSKFIYLERDAYAWKKSFNNWAIKHNGVAPDMNKSFNAFLQHKEFVMNYFKNRKEDLLIVDVSDPLAYKKLGNFLECAAPQPNLPHFNKA